MSQLLWRRLHTVQAGPAIPAVLLRVGLALLGVLALVLTDLALWRVLLVVAGLAAAAAPRSFLPWVLILLVPVGLLSEPTSLTHACLAVLIVHAAHVLGSLAFVIGPRGWITLRALRPTALRFVAIQLISQAFVVLAVTWLHPVRGTSVAWFAVLGAGAVVLLGGWLLRLVLLAGRD